MVVPIIECGGWGIEVAVVAAVLMAIASLLAIAATVVVIVAVG